MCFFVALLPVLRPFSRLKTERPVLDRPLKVGGGIQPRLVTVLTPATTFTVGQDFSQKARAVNSTRAVIYYFYVPEQFAYGSTFPRVLLGGARNCLTTESGGSTEWSEDLLGNRSSSGLYEK